MERFKQAFWVGMAVFLVCIAIDMFLAFILWDFPPLWVFRISVGIGCAVVVIEYWRNPMNY